MMFSKLRSECCDRMMLPGERFCPGCGVECRVYEMEVLKTEDLKARNHKGELIHPHRLEPTLAHKLRRMNPAERTEVRAIMNALTLRKTIRAVLREARMVAELSKTNVMLKQARDSAVAFFNQGAET